VRESAILLMSSAMEARASAVLRSASTSDACQGP
jgi:hypothetical protein